MNGNKVPFYSQRVDESNFQQEAFPDVRTAKDWTDRICGLACVKMVVAHFTDEVIPLGRLLQQGLKVDAYIKGTGWVHRGLATLASQFGVRGHAESIGTDIARISTCLNRGELVVASVGDGLDGTRRGGHLIVIVNSTASAFIVHHPSSDPDYDWPNHHVDHDLFSRCFSANGNIIRFSGNGIPTNDHSI